MCIGKSSEFGMYFTDQGACECEIDCKKVCEACNKYFCEIKDECNFKHDEELHESVITNSGMIFCHSNCLREFYS